MCRWLAYSGTPMRLEELVTKPEHSLVDQSRHARLGTHTANGDGFGIGWYGDAEAPAIYRSIHPAWNDRNLREVAAAVTSGLFFAHVRASTHSAIQESNCHPFRHGRWLWMHNGLIRDFARVRRELLLAVDESLFPFIEGTTDSETMFYLALGFGLEHDPPRAVERMAGLVEEVCLGYGIENPLRMTVATTDGERIWAFRYSSESASPSLYYSTSPGVLQELYPHNEQLGELSDESRLVVSEPLRDLPGGWLSVPESSYGVIQPGQDELRPFHPLVA